MNIKETIVSNTTNKKKDNTASNRQKPKFLPSINSPVNLILHLQRTIGNPAVQRIFQSGSIPIKHPVINRVHLSPEKPEKSEFRLHGKIIPNSIKAQVKDKFPELHKLIENNPLDESFVNAHTEKIGDIEHIWQISVLFEKFPVQSMSVNGITKEVESPQGKPHIHRIEIRCNKSRFAPIEETRKQYPNKREQLAAIHAETLSHELIHAGIIIDKKIKVLFGRKSPRAVNRIAQIVDFNKMLEVAYSSAVSVEKNNIVELLREMAFFSHLYKKPKEREREVKKWFDWFIEEKYATQTSESTFGFPFSENWKIAYRYTKLLYNILTHRIAQEKKAGKKLFKDQSEEDLCKKILADNKNLLQNVLRKLYDKIDDILRKRLTPGR